MNKYVKTRPYADPEVAARKIIELANAISPIQDGRIYIEKINGPFLLFETMGAGPATSAAILLTGFSGS
jgi:hypothetical protein